MNFKELKTYIFDFDGTLVDSMPTFISVMLRILDERGIKYKDDIVKIITPLGYLGTARYYRESFGLSESEDDLIKIMKEYAKDAYETSIPDKPSVAAALHSLKEKGASLSVLTASPHDALDPCLKRLGLFDLFDFVWSSDDFPYTKAQPEIYKEAAKRIGVDVRDIVFIDDNPCALRAAMTAGTVAVGVYDKSAEEYKEEIRSFASGYMESFAELI